MIETIEKLKLKLEDFEKKLSETSNIPENFYIIKMINEQKQGTKIIYDLLLEIKRKSDFIKDIKSNLEAAIKDLSKGYESEAEEELDKIIFLINTEQMR